jgi:Zn-dependent protease
MDTIIAIFSLIVLLFSVIIHELAHGYVAYSLGDPTAKYAGRLTLNPIPHLDLFGSIILPLLLFISGSPFLVGWAKPVPINPYNFTDQKWGSLKVAIAGPATNFLIALIFGLLMRVLGLPIETPFAQFLAMVVGINLMLALFNLVPIPPLDGHWILFTFLPDTFATAKNFLRQYGLYLLLFLMFFNGLSWLGNIMVTIFHIITGI